MSRTGNSSSKEKTKHREKNYSSNYEILNSMRNAITNIGIDYMYMYIYVSSPSANCMNFSIIDISAMREQAITKKKYGIHECSNIQINYAIAKMLIVHRKYEKK